MAHAYVAIGSNILPEQNVRAALAALALRADVEAVSTVYETQPVGRPGQPVFYNCAVSLAAWLPALALKLEVLRPIEAQLGRRRTRDKYAPRPIDLDLVLYDDLVSNSAELVLPDPEIKLRPFLAVPLSELAPDLKYPGSNLSMADIARGLGREGMRPLAEYTASLRESLVAASAK